MNYSQVFWGLLDFRTMEYLNEPSFSVLPMRQNELRRDQASCSRLLCKSKEGSESYGVKPPARRLHCVSTNHAAGMARKREGSRDGRTPSPHGQEKRGNSRWQDTLCHPSPSFLSPVALWDPKCIHRTLFLDLMGYNLPGFFVHGILQARILEWVSTPFSRGIFPTQGLDPGLLLCRQIL